MNLRKTWFKEHRVLLFLVVCVIGVYALSYAQRQSSYQYWMDNSDRFVVGDVTAMSAYDAYYWLKMARELDAGTIGIGRPEPTKGYPDGQLLAIKDTPGLLAEMISWAKYATGGNYYRAGLLLVPLLAGLFVFPLFIYFYRIGYGPAGLLGGLIGTFCYAYYHRTTMGRVDTDLLNLFFPLLIACFILPICRQRDLRGNLALAAGAGLSIYLFIRWYQQPSVILVYAGILAVYLLLGRVAWRHSLAILLVFLVMTGPYYLLQVGDSVATFLKAYVTPSGSGGGAAIVWPDVLTIVAEAQKRGPATVLKRLHGFLPLVFIGLGGLTYLFIRHVRSMVPLVPMLLLGGWALIGPNRFAMYLAPLIGVGVGVLIELLVRFLARYSDWLTCWKVPVSVALMGVLFFSTAGYTGYGSHPGPAIDAETTRALLEIKKRVPHNAAMFTPTWAHGYPLMEIGDFATYHDGGLQGGMRTTLIAKALFSSRQQDMVSLISYLEDHGFRGLRQAIRTEQLNAEQMLGRVFNYSDHFTGKNVYVLYLNKNLWKSDTLAYFGTWDFQQRKSHPLTYVQLNCFSMTDKVMRCRDGTVDLNRGFMNDGQIDIPLKGALFINNGHVVEEQTYPHQDGYYLQVLLKDGKIDLILVADQELFQTNFNQQYLLGRFDRRYFEEVYNDFPVARLLKVKNSAGEGQ